MSAFSRGYAHLIRRSPQSVCLQCRRSLSVTPFRSSGHNKWSKIKHEKGAADLKKTAVNTQFANDIALYTKRS